MKLKYPTLLEGTIYWFHPDGSAQKFAVEQACFRSSKEIAFDCNCGDAQRPYVYTINLQRTHGSRFEGEFAAGRGKNDSSGKCRGELTAGTSKLIWAGKWLEGGYESACLALLQTKRSKRRVR